MPRVDNDLSGWSKDWRRLQQQKHRFRGGVEARILINLAMYFGEHAASQSRDSIFSRPKEKEEDKNKLNLVFSLLRKQTRRKLGRLWSIAPEFSATPDKRDPVAYDQADVVNKLILALDKKVSEHHQQWLRLWWILLAGVVVEHVPWILESTQEPIPEFDEATGEIIWIDSLTKEELPQSEVVTRVQTQGRTVESFKPKETLKLVGDVGSEIISPLNFFIDSSVPSVRALSPDQACYIVEMKTVGWVEENFGTDAAKKINGNKDLTIVRTRLLDTGPSLSNINMRDLIPAIQGSRDTDDPPICLVATRYSPRSREWPNGHRSIFVPDQVVLDDDEIPYEEIPLVDIHWEPNATTFWTGDFITDLIPAQKFLNKRMSQLGEAANAMIYEILLLGGELSKKDIPSDLPGVVEDGLAEDGTPRVASLQRQSLPSWFLETIKFIVEYIENVGGADLLQNKKFPGQLRGSLSAPILQEILDSEDGPFYDHLGEQLAMVKQMRVNRVKQFYEPIRTLHFTGADQRDETMSFHSSDVLRAGTEFNITVDRSSLLPEIAALREARIRERLEGPMAVLYVNPRTGKIDPSKIAEDLKYNDRFRESRESQYRRLAQQIIAKLWQGEPLDPSIPLPFWDHNVVMDELESAMATTEWISASTEVKQAFVQFHEKSRQFLAAIQQSAAQAMESRQVQGAVAQAVQQAAAKAASMAADLALEQIYTQNEMAQARPMRERLLEEMNAEQPPARRAPGPMRPPTRVPAR